jgi:hypothetical protein
LFLAEPEIEKVMNMVGTAAAKLKNRLEMNSNDLSGQVR